MGAAVERNRAKRLVRELFRHNKPSAASTSSSCRAAKCSMRPMSESKPNSRLRSLEPRARAVKARCLAASRSRADSRLQDHALTALCRQLPLYAGLRGLHERIDRAFRRLPRWMAWHQAPLPMSSVWRTWLRSRSRTPRSIRITSTSQWNVRVLLAITLSFLVLFLFQRFVMPPPAPVPSAPATTPVQISRTGAATAAPPDASDAGASVAASASTRRSRARLRRLPRP